VRIRAVEAFGLLDEDSFSFLEETEWCYRAHQQGWQVWQVPEAQAVHLQGSTAKRYEALARIEFQRSKLLYFAKTAPRFARLYPVIFGFQAMINAVSNSVIMVLGGGFFSKSRRRTAVYWRVFLWYITGRPSHVGLPGKCPQGLVT
jgi:Predicted glycosyltransferases